MAVAFYIPSVDEEDQQVKPNQAYHQQYQQHQQQQQQQQQQHNQSDASTNMSQQVCSSAEYGSQHLMLLFHEILIAYAREAVLAQQAATVSSPASPCMLCKKLYYLFRRIY